MRKDCKDNLIAEAHNNPEYAKMSAKKLANFIDADQTTISKWRRKIKNIAYGINIKALHSELTIESVRKNWEKKYAALNRQYDALADRLVEMAKNADKHRNKENDMRAELFLSQQKLADAMDCIELYRSQLAQEKKSWYKRLFS